MSHIKAVVFDFGGVIELYNMDVVNSICEVLGVSKKEWQDVYFKYNYLTNIDKKTWMDCALFVSEKLGADDEKLKKIKEIIISYEKGKFLNFGIIEIIKKLRNLGYKTAILSNYRSLDFLNKKLKDYEIIDLFDEVLVSGDLGFQKPEPGIFKVLFERLDVLPKEVVFIDDTLHSLNTSDLVGYKPILFKENTVLKKDLENILGSIF